MSNAETYVMGIVSRVLVGFRLIKFSGKIKVYICGLSRIIIGKGNKYYST